MAALKAAHITKGKVALFVGRMDMQNAIERKQGLDETLGKVPGIEVLPVFLDHADRALAKKNVEDALARYPDLVLAIGIWSYNGPCMADAVRASARQKKPVLVVFDEEEETLKAVKDGLICGDHRPASVRVRVPVDQGAERDPRREDLAAHHRHGHPGHRQGERRRFLERAARPQEVKKCMLDDSD